MVFLGDEVEVSSDDEISSSSPSSHAEKILQPVKAAPSKVSSGVPLTLDHPILEVKCKVLVNQLSKAVRFCFFSCSRIHHFNIFALISSPYFFAFTVLV